MTDKPCPLCGVDRHEPANSPCQVQPTAKMYDGDDGKGPSSENLLYNIGFEPCECGEADCDAYGLLVTTSDGAIIAMPVKGPLTGELRDSLTNMAIKLIAACEQIKNPIIIMLQPGSRIGKEN